MILYAPFLYASEHPWLGGVFLSFHIVLQIKYALHDPPFASDGRHVSISRLPQTIPANC